MFAECALAAAVEAAAGIAAEMIDTGDALAEPALRGGLDDVAFPQQQRGGDGAGGDEPGGGEA